MLRRYAVILLQRIRGKGLNSIINSAIRYRPLPQKDALDGFGAEIGREFRKSGTGLIVLWQGKATRTGGDRSYSGVAFYFIQLQK